MMQTVIDVSFSLIISALILPLVLGLQAMCEYIVNKNKERKAWNVVIAICAVMINFTLIVLIYRVAKTTEINSLENYIKITIYTVALAIISSDCARKNLYQDILYEI